MTDVQFFSGSRITAARHRDHVAVVRLGNPPEGYMDDVTEAELGQVLDAIDADAGLRVVVITGAQPHVFVRHYDVRVLEQRGRTLAARGLKFSTDRAVPEAPVHRCYRRIERSDRIFIAAINGVAMGGGFELALACDLRIAQDGDYRIGLPETSIGILPGAGGTQRLTRLLGSAKALEMILMGRTASPSQAADLGMVNECCDGPALARALEWATALAARHTRALAHVKRLVRGAFEAPIDAGLADERTLFCDLMGDADAIERMAHMNRSGVTLDRVTQPPWDD